MNLLKVAQTFATEDQALDYLVASRWPNGVRCLACDHDKVYRIDTHGKTKKPCRIYECAACGLHFTATTGTLFHDSHLPLQKWFAVIALMTEAKKGISAKQVERHIGVSYKTAWYLCHRIRKAMEESFFIPLGDSRKIVEVDEAFIGGKKLRQVRAPE
jgi:transposase-like protein